MEATRYVAEHSRANIMVVEDEEQYAKVGFIIFFLHVVAELWFWIYLIPIRIQHFN